MNEKKDKPWRPEIRPELVDKTKHAAIDAGITAAEFVNRAIQAALDRLPKGETR